MSQGESGPSFLGAELLEELDPEFARHYHAFVDAGQEALPQRERWLLHVAVAGNSAIRDEARLRAAMERALEHGATPEQVLEVLELVSLIASHALTESLAALMPATPAEDVSGGGYRKSFERYFPGFHRQFEVAMPRAFEAYEALGKLMWSRSSLEPKWRELVFVAMDLVPSHLYPRGVRLHVENARHYGASEEEIVGTISVAMSYGAWPLVGGLRVLEELTGSTRGAEA